MHYGLVFLLSLFVSILESWGAEWQPEAHGAQAVEAAVQTTQHLFSDTELADVSVFLRRIAKVESQYGEDSRTYRPHYFGGIWQMDRVAYEETKRVSAHPRLAKWHCAIQKKSAESGLRPIEWSSTRWEQLAAPVSCYIYISLGNALGYDALMLRG